MEALDNVIRAAIADGAFPGACYAVSVDGSISFGAHGRQMYCPESNRIDIETLWDLASVTKVVATTTCAMLLVDDGRLDLDRPVWTTIPGFVQQGKTAITPRNLLLHNSGLAPFREYVATLRTSAEAISAVYAEPLTYPTGTKSVYSDLGIIVLGKLIEALAGEPLDRFASRAVFGEIGMASTRFCPPAGIAARCAPTEPIEPWRRAIRELRNIRPADAACTQHPDSAHYIQGEVHDPNAFLLDGVAGHAGLFAPVGDLAKFMTAMLARGRVGARQLISPETVDMFTRRQDETSSRALGWDTKSPTGSTAGDYFSSRSFGHTGFTGTSVWADPESGVFAVLLTNRVHPTSANERIAKVRPAFHNAFRQAIGR